MIYEWNISTSRDRLAKYIEEEARKNYMTQEAFILDCVSMSMSKTSEQLRGLLGIRDAIDNLLDHSH